jgi:hypothetical protein
MLKSKTPLKSKATLKASTALKSRSKLKTTPKHSVSKLKAKADKLFAFYIRLRDSEWQDGSRVGKCITCERICVVINAQGKRQKSNGWGHFIGRGDWNLRYDEENVNLQCSHCNAWRDKNSMLDAYKLALDDKYGDGTAAKLVAASITDKRGSLTVKELEQIIEDSALQIKLFEAQSMLN